MDTNIGNVRKIPDWVPDAVRLYLSHTEDGVSLRALARGAGCHASTVLRQVRRFENRRDDPLVDEALGLLAAGGADGGLCPGLAEDRTGFAARPPAAPFPHPESDAMTAALPKADLKAVAETETIEREARRILRRLSEPGAQLVIAPDMALAAVLRPGPADPARGEAAAMIRTGVVDRAVARAFALRDWIACRHAGRVAVYRITATGRLALKRMLAEADAHAEQHRDMASRRGPDPDTGEMADLRCNMAESPVAMLGRRRDKDGKPFLPADLVTAAERLREDFEIAQMGPRVAQNWDRFLSGGDRGNFAGAAGPAEGPRAARDRVAAALRDLGPGLGDVALRVCCYLEGLEAVERRLGWAARSGKVVLRIALQRLRRHYDETYGRSGPLIG